MKKILVIAMSLLFAASAFAVEVKVSGYHELEGRMVNNNLWTKKDEVSSAQYYQHLRIWAAFKVDEQVSFVVRVQPVKDHIWGAKWADSEGGSDKTGGLNADRYFGVYKFNDMLTVKAGKMTSEDYYVKGFGTINADAVYTGGASGGFEQIQADITAAEGMKVFAIVRKVTESSFANTDGNIVASKSKSKSIDADAYIVGANLDLGGVKILPSIGYHTDLALEDFKAIKGYVGVIADAGMATISGAVAVDYTDGKALYTADEDSATLFGAFVQADVAVNDTMNAGAAVAYGSSDKNTDTAFAFGDDFGYTYLLEDKVLDGAGFGGGIAAYLFGDIKVMPAVTVSATVAYFKTMIDKKNAYTANFTEKSQAIEADLVVAYEFTPSTTFSAGVAYLQGTKVVNNKDDAGIFGGFWNAYTKF